MSKRKGKTLKHGSLTYIESYAWSAMPLQSKGGAHQLLTSETTTLERITDRKMQKLPKMNNGFIQDSMRR